MSKNESYEEFTEKFKPKLTTDDCYTPELVYDAVADWVANEYGLDRASFVRPFWPGGNYQAEKYPDGCVVVDNPPFSIITSICEWYQQQGIRFFLFAPCLTIFSGYPRHHACAVCAYCDIEYENGARVKTSFLTNLETCAARSAPSLYTAVQDAVKAIRSEQVRSLQKYEYTVEVLTVSALNKMSRYGVDFKVDNNDVAYTRQLDAQKEAKKTIFWSGFYLSEKAAAEKAAAEKAAAEKAAAEKAAAIIWELSDREKEICRGLDAIRRSVAARNSDPARMRRWLDDLADRTEGGHENGDQRDPVSE